MTINLANFQLATIKNLLESMDESCREIVLKSPTGSGKTIILTHFMDEYVKGHAKTVFVWLTPGKGNLEEQSKAKMDKYIHNAQTKLLSDVMTGGFDKTGASEDIDIFSPKKFEVLKTYLHKYGLKGGFVRYDKQSEELCICTESYNDDIHSDDWKILRDIFK